MMITISENHNRVDYTVLNVHKEYHRAYNTKPICESLRVDPLFFLLKAKANYESCSLIYH